MVERYLPLARSVALRYRHTPESLEDLMQVAAIGLMKAVDGFDPDRGVAFSSYAVPTIVGELKRYFRDSSWALHVPRELKERVLAVERCERQLFGQLRRSPTVAEVAGAAGLTDEQVLDALQARSAHDAVPLEPAPDPTQPSDHRALDAGAAEDERLALVEDRDALADALRTLPPRDREILRLRLTEDLTQTEIAGRVGLSQMQVSRILRRVMGELTAAVDSDR